MENDFPNLKNTGFKITSPRTIEYNCIAWAAEDQESWWWPDQNKQYYWPPDVPREENIEAFIKAFEILGYRVCQDIKFEKGFIKIAIYAEPNGKPTHAARQLESGKWTSKLGGFEDIEHNDIEGVSGGLYGSVSIIMKKPIIFLVKS